MLSSSHKSEARSIKKLELRKLYSFACFEENKVIAGSTIDHVPFQIKLYNQRS